MYRKLEYMPQSFLAAPISVGIFATPGATYLLQHPQDIGPLLGILVQLIGLALALIARVATVVARLHRPRHTCTVNPI